MSYNECDVSFNDQQKIELLKSLRDSINWKKKEERKEFIQRLENLFGTWNGQLPNLGAIFRSKQIERLLLDSINYSGRQFIDFVARSGYKDEPEVDTNGKISLRRTTPVHHAVRFKFRTIVHDLFKIYSRTDVNYTDESGYSHFHVACMFGCQEIVKKFLELGQDPNYLVEKTGASPLHLALDENQGNVAELLLRSGADPNIANKNGLNALHIVCSRYNRDSGTMNMLFELTHQKFQPLQINARSKSGNTPLHLAAVSRDRNAIDFLLRRDGDPHLANEKGLTPLHIICQSDKDDNLAEIFFQITEEVNRPVQIDAQDKDGKTSLHWAIHYGIEKLTRFLLRRGVNPNLADSDGSTPLHYICNSHRGNWLRIFFSVTDDMQQTVLIDARDNLGRTPLHWALSRGLDRVAEFLLRRGADPNSANEEGLTPLHIICNRNYNDDLLGIFFQICGNLQHTVQIDAQDKLGNTSLHLALKLGHCAKKNAVKLLLRNNADPNLVNGEGTTPLHILCQRDEDDGMMALFCATCRQAANVNAQDRLGNTPLHWAIISKNPKVAKFLLRRGANPNSRNEEGLTPLHCICMVYKDVDLAEFFFKFNGDIAQAVQVNARDKLGNSPLLFALDNGHKDVAELLLRNGANSSLANEEGSTPLHIICKAGHSKGLAEMFFEINDERHQTLMVDVVDKSGRTPLQLAVANLNLDVIDVLLDRGADLSSFVFPNEIYFGEGVEYYFYWDKLNLASRVLAIVDRLEKKGYELDQSDAVTIMKLFARRRLFKKSTDLHKTIRPKQD
ncbi:ankyrin-1-like [Trichogramma pretiosum]|uniref:ankyrin-1-like n=1 Tax=Trichogramma pretiosum TaxID=7493 RepID=UPI000C71AE2B|nr:ankyrin-1-like [Trichogramma pretiosum]